MKLQSYHLLGNVVWILIWIVCTPIWNFWVWAMRWIEIVVLLIDFEKSSCHFLTLKHLLNASKIETLIRCSLQPVKKWKNWVVLKLDAKTSSMVQFTLIWDNASCWVGYTYVIIVFIASCAYVIFRFQFDIWTAISSSVFILLGEIQYAWK